MAGTKRFHLRACVFQGVVYQSLHRSSYRVGCNGLFARHEDNAVIFCGLCRVFFPNFLNQGFFFVDRL
jgi:hypothetical protein